MLFALLGRIPLPGADVDCVIRDLKGAQNLNLDTCRPEPITIAEKAAVLKTLPVEGAVTHLGSGEQRKIQSLDAVLRAHRRTGVYELRAMVNRRSPRSVSLMPPTTTSRR